MYVYNLFTILSTLKSKTKQQQQHQQSHAKRITKPDQSQPESHRGASHPHHLLISPTPQNGQRNKNRLYMFTHVGFRYDRA